MTCSDDTCFATLTAPAYSGRSGRPTFEAKDAPNHQGFPAYHPCVGRSLKKAEIGLRTYSHKGPSTKKRPEYKTQGKFTLCYPSP